VRDRDSRWDSGSDGHDPTSTEVEVVDLGQNSRIGRELEGIKL
jgi:hypothetical protein